MSNLVERIAETADRHPEQTAVSFSGAERTYADFWSRTSRFAAALAERGVEPGDRVAVYLPNLPQFVTAFHGTLRAGGIVVPMNPQYKSREIGHLLADSGARVVVTLAALVPFVKEVQSDTDVEHVVTVDEPRDGAVTFEAFLSEEEQPVVDREDDDVAVQPYTSGTTGKPKGVLLTHENLRWNAEVAGDLLPEGTTPADKQLGVLPLFHIYGMTVVMNTSLFNGAAYYPLPEWDAQTALSLVEDEELTIVHGVPAMYNDVINQENAAEFDLSSVRFANSGGSGIPVEVHRQFEELFDIDLYEGYGLTETSPVSHANRPNERRIGSIGTPLPGLRSKVVDEEFEELPRVERGPVNEDEADLDQITGEVVVAGPSVMDGYYDLPEANDEAFTEVDGTQWFHTGDIGYWDEDDFFYVVDRKKHMINTAGYNVYPREVEEFLFEHDAVVDAAVVGIPDDRRGETVKAFVVPAPDADVTEDDLKRYCLDNMAEYKHPREVAFIDELPRTTTGKVQKFELRDDGA